MAQSLQSKYREFTTVFGVKMAKTAPEVTGRRYWTLPSWKEAEQALESAVVLEHEANTNR